MNNLLFAPRSGASRLLRGAVASLSLVSSLAFADPTGHINVYFGGNKIDGTTGFEEASAEGNQIIAAPGYNFRIEGTIRGTEGTPMSSIITEGMSIADFIDSITDHGSRFLHGSVPNPSESLPKTLFDLPISGNREIDGIGKVTFNLRLTAILAADGTASLSVTGVDIHSTPAQQLGAIKFMQGSKLQVHAAPEFTFRRVFSSGYENEESVRISVYRNFDIETRATVRIKTVNGTADSSDFTPLDQRIVFKPGKNSVDLKLFLKDNLVVDSPKTRNLKVKLTKPGLNSYLGDITEMTVYIRDNESLPAGLSHGR